MTAVREHWNEIFSTTADSELGWFEKTASQTLKFLDLIPRIESPAVFLPGAGTSVLVDELMMKGYRLILNDISDEALRKLRDRLGAHDGLTWLRHDIAEPLPDTTPQADIWIDRAVLHFLLPEAAIQGYFANLRRTVRPGGYVLLAEFSEDGAPKCAGLELHRYSMDEMTERMGPGFMLVKQEHFTYVNPWGSPRPYVYGLYRRAVVISNTGATNAAPEPK